jgi:hypothetical protein
MAKTIGLEKIIGAATLAAVVAVGCGDEGRSGGGDDGVLVFALTNAPTDVLCVSVRVEGSRVAVHSFGVTPGQATTAFTAGGLPIGPATMTASTYGTACASVTAAAVPTWISDRVMGTIAREPPLQITFVMRRNGQAVFGFDFQDDATTQPAPGLQGWAVLAPQRLLSFDLEAPAAAFRSSVTIAGLQAGEIVQAIDFRPASGALYLLGSTSRLYQVDTATGAATPVGAPFTPLLMGGEFGFDFNPTVDRVRITSPSGQNLRVNPATGAVVSIDGNVTPAGLGLEAIAYANNVAGATTTTLYGLALGTSQLIIIEPANNGTAVPVGALGTTFGASTSFDIAGSPDRAFAVAPNGAIFRIDLATGTATAAGILPTGGQAVRGFAMQL